MEAAVANQMRVTLELGPKGKKVVTVAPDWPGLERGAKTGEDAIERLRSYSLRYSQVAKLAEMDAEFDAITAYFEPPSIEECFNLIRYERA